MAVPVDYPPPMHRTGRRRLLVAVLFMLASPQDWYGAFKTIHVVFAVIWIGGGFLISALAFIAELEHDLEGRSILAKQAASVSQRVGANFAERKKLSRGSSGWTRHWTRGSSSLSK